MSNGTQPNKIRLLLTAALCGAGLLFLVVYFTDLQVQDIKDWIRYWTDEIQSWPAVLFFLMVTLLPLIGFPISPLLIIAGVRFGVVWAILFSLSALAVNLILAYWISTKVLHNFIQKIVSKWNYNIPKVSHQNAAKLVLVIRLCGAPLAVQNYILGLSHVPFWSYLWVSLVVQVPVAIGIIVFGESFLSGKIGKALIGLGVLVIALIAVSYLRKRYAQPKSGSVDTAGG